MIDIDKSPQVIWYLCSSNILQLLMLWYSSIIAHLAFRRIFKSFIFLSILWEIVLSNPYLCKMQLGNIFRKKRTFVLCISYLIEEDIILYWIFTFKRNFYYPCRCCRRCKCVLNKYRHVLFIFKFKSPVSMVLFDLFELCGISWGLYCFL